MMIMMIVMMMMNDYMPIPMHIFPLTRGIVISIWNSVFFVFGDGFGYLHIVSINVHYQRRSPLS